MSERKPVPGFPADFARVLTALEVVELMEGGGTEGVRGAMRFAQLCTVDESGARVWPAPADVESAPWPRVKACALAGFEINGLIEGAAGN